YQLYAFFNGTADKGRDNAPSLALWKQEELARRKQIHVEMIKLELTLLQSDPLAAAARTKLVQARLADLKKQEAAVQPATTLARQERDKPRPTFVHLRGNFTKKGDPVAPGVPAKLHGLHRRDEPGASSGKLQSNRLDFARWLVDQDNPLVGRVT